MEWHKNFSEDTRPSKETEEMEVFWQGSHQVAKWSGAAFTRIYLLCAYLTFMVVFWLQADLEGAKAEVQKWHSAFEKESFIPPGSSVGQFFLSHCKR